MPNPSDLTTGVTKPWRKIAEVTSLAIAATVTGAASWSLNDGVALASGGNMVVPDGLLVVAAADQGFIMESKTPRLRVVTEVANNATAWGAGGTISPGLFPLTVAGGVGVVTATLGANAIPAGALAKGVVTPVASTAQRVSTDDFALPADGAYMLGIVSSAAWAANTAALVKVSAEIDFV